MKQLKHLTPLHQESNPSQISFLIPCGNFESCFLMQIQKLHLKIEVPKIYLGELSALGMNLKYELQQYIFHICPTKYTKQLKKINIEQVYLKRTMFPTLRVQIPTYNGSENYLITAYLLQ